MSIVRNFNLYLNAGNGAAPYINANQYDQGEQWVFTLYQEDGTKYMPSTGAIVGIKSDRQGIINTGTVDEEGRVVINETQQMTAAAGRAIFELLIDSETHGTANFIVMVEPRPGDNADLSDSDLSLIQQAVDAAATIEDLIEGHDPDEVIADAVDAWLDDHPEATTTVQDGAITEAKLNAEVKTGVFEDMTVGTSLAVMNDEGTTDNLAYKFRPTGGDAVRELDEIVGGTIAWNQHSINSYPTNTVAGVTFTRSADGSHYTIDGTASARGSFIFNSSFPAVPNHKVLIIGNKRVPSTNTNYIGLAGIAVDTGNGGIFNVPSSAYTTLRFDFYTGDTFNNLDIYPQAFDLTAMFGSTVADAIYAMEQSSAGSGVAYFRSLFPENYYAYNAGELVSVEGLSAHETTESNIFGGEDLADTIVANIPNATKDTATKTVSFPSSTANGKVLFDTFKPNTQYTVILYGRNLSTSSKVTNMRIVYTDDSTQYLEFNTVNALSYCVATSTAGKSIAKIGGIYMANTTVLYYEQCGLFEGVLTEADFKPYKKHTYPLDSTLTLRGVPKWNNGLYFDGDIYRHDGSVQRRYGVLDLGSVTWSNPSAGRFHYLLSSALRPSSTSVVANILCPKYTAVSQAATWADGMVCLTTDGQLYVIDSAYTSAADFKTAMSGVYLVYELATPTTESADPYQQYQICDGKGTEEYISTSVTPVGHNTFYPVDIVAKVNKLPSDFSTLIAPTETGFKATRNYTVNDLLIINNVLYKVTANIANGGTITVNTNVQQTTLSALIKALS